jgi:hypothetical protein
MLQDVNGKFFGNTGYIEKVLSDNLLVDCMQLTSANSFTPLSINVNQYIFYIMHRQGHRKSQGTPAVGDR